METIYTEIGYFEELQERIAKWKESNLEENDLKKKFKNLETHVYFTLKLTGSEKFNLYYEMGIKPFTTTIILVGYAEFFLDKFNLALNYALSNYVGWKDEYVL